MTKRFGIALLPLLTFVFLFAGVSGPVWAQNEKTTLITMKDGKPVAALAKSWKKSGAGKYEFQLDPKATIGKKKPLTTDAVKSSLEGRLGSSHGVKVAAKGKAAVEVTFTGEELAFLEAVSTAKIRATKSVELALESSTTQGAIRARATDRAPTPEEVKATVTENKDGMIVVRVLAVGANGEAVKFKTGEKAKIKAASDAKVNDVVYFVPDQLTDGVWTVKAIAK